MSESLILSRLVKVPEPVLKRRCERVGIFGPPIVKLAKDMFQIVDDWQLPGFGKAVGLAAPQIGESIQLAVVCAPGFPKFVMVNPEIEWAKGAAVCEEGCLSVPGAKVNVLRATKIRVRYFNENGRAISIVATDFLARVIQHECEHLQGRLITDGAA